MVCNMRRSKTKEKGSKRPEINIDSYNSRIKEKGYPVDPGKLSADQKRNMLAAGVDPSGKNRCGTYLQMDHDVVHSSSLYPGIEVMSITDALDKHEWLDNYVWKLVPYNQDKFTREAQKRPHHGYFVRIQPGVKALFPVQSCLFMHNNNITQNVHNVIIAEEGADLQIITGCATADTVSRGLHIGVSEIYVKKGARLTFTMIHNWAEDIAVRPRTVIEVEEGGTFLSNYICLQPVSNLQMYPMARLVGRGAVARFNSLLFARPGSYLDIGSGVLLMAPEAKAEIISRAVSAGGDIIARGRLKGTTEGIKAHLECRGLIVSKKGTIHAIPELEANVSGVDMSHEAAVGKIAREEIEYLMARGVSRQEAQAVIVRGFLDTSIMGLPRVLKRQIDETILSCEKDMF